MSWEGGSDAMISYSKRKVTLCFFRILLDRKPQPIKKESIDSSVETWETGNRPVRLSVKDIDHSLWYYLPLIIVVCDNISFSEEPVSTRLIHPRCDSLKASGVPRGVPT